MNDKLGAELLVGTIPLVCCRKSCYVSYSKTGGRCKKMGKARNLYLHTYIC